MQNLFLLTISIQLQAIGGEKQVGDHLGHVDLFQIQILITNIEKKKDHRKGS